MSVDVKTVGIILAYVALGLVGDLLLSRGMRAMPKPEPGPRGAHVRHYLRYIFSSGTVIAGIVALATNFSMLLGLLSFADVSLVVPSRAFAYLFLTILARWVLHERVPPQRWVGTLMVSAGVALVLLTSGAGERDHEGETERPSGPVSATLAKRIAAE